MYKIRTLKPEAEDLLTDSLLMPGSGLELRFGKFLRWTRLDELPQVFNVLQGEMSFIGPRPLRPVLYERFRRLIPNYDRQFLVKPGLIGYSQFLTPHTTPKRIRTLIDNYFIHMKRNPLGDIVFVGYATARLTRNLGREVAETVGDYVSILRHQKRWHEMRKSRRMGGGGCQVYLTDALGRALSGRGMRVIDLNHEAVCVESDLELGLTQNLRLILTMNLPGDGRVKKARCKGFVYRKTRQTRHGSGPSDRFWTYVLFYEPVSEFNRYIVDQYMLRQSIAPVHGAARRRRER